jgi:regulatory protein YycH of two-component signal transduction system YycFG
MLLMALKIIFKGVSQKMMMNREIDHKTKSIEQQLPIKEKMLNRKQMVKANLLFEKMKNLMFSFKISLKI